MVPHLSMTSGYRETALRVSGIAPLFPLWGRRTDEVAQTLVTRGYRAVVTCVDTAQAPREIIGRWVDEELLAGLPDGVDPCGENGEFHTVVLDAPMFSRPLEVTIGETVQRDGFLFADVVPVVAAGSAEPERPGI